MTHYSSELNRRISDAVEKMPAFPKSVQKILELTRDIDCQPKDVVSVIENDPVIAVKILKAYLSLSPGQVVQLGSATVTAVLLNHTMINFGYRVDSNGKSVFFTGDHEPYYNIYAPADENFRKYQELIEEREQTILEILRGVDVLIADASYTAEEYPTKKGWGHGTYDSCIDLAKKAGAKILCCTHHEPSRNDDALEQEFENVLARHPQRNAEPEYRLAREGEEIEI